MLLFGKLLTISLATNIRLLQTERSLQMTISCLMKMAESSQNGKKTLREKEKLLITSNFSFSNSVFKRPFLQTRENQGLFGKGLSNSYVTFPNPRLSNSSGSFFLDPEKKKTLRKQCWKGRKYWIPGFLFTRHSSEHVYHFILKVFENFVWLIRRNLTFKSRKPRRVRQRPFLRMDYKYRPKYFHDFNLFPNKPWFLRVCSARLLKTLREKEKLLVTSNFSFSHSVFYPFGKLSAIFIKFEIVVCKLFQSLKFVVRERVNFIYCRLHMLSVSSSPKFRF